MALCDTGAYSTAFHACNCINCVHNCENHNGNTVVEIRDDGDENWHDNDCRENYGGHDDYVNGDGDYDNGMMMMMMIDMISTVEIMMVNIMIMLMVMVIMMVQWWWL